MNVRATIMKRAHFDGARAVRQRARVCLSVDPDLTLFTGQTVLAPVPYAAQTGAPNANTET